jgi:hypothetical protein
MTPNQENKLTIALLLDCYHKRPRMSALKKNIT